ncbi:MAG: hypothetical protein AB1755_06590 [Candidatus Omnitrophota bacterium]
MNLSTNKFIICIIFIFNYICLFTNNVWAVGYAITQLTNNNYSDTAPEIHNGQAIWTGVNGDDSEIFFYDGNQIIQLTDNNYDDNEPQIHNGQAVWYGGDFLANNIDDEIFFYNGAQVIQLTNNNDLDFSPQIHNGQIVWESSQRNGLEIFLYNGAQTIQLTNNAYDDEYPKIDNGQAVWTGYDGNDKILFYNGNQTIQLVNTNYDVWEPQIDNGQVVWYGYDGNDNEIFFYNGNQTVQLTNNNYTDARPQIDNGQVVWTGVNGDDSEIFLYNGNQIIQLTDNNYDDNEPQIHNGQAVWTGVNGDDSEIFFYDGVQTIQLTNNDYDDWNPQIHNGQIVWNGQAGWSGRREIFLATPRVGIDAEVEILDGSHFSAGLEISNDPQRLVSGGNSVTGVVADEVTRLLIRLAVDNDVNMVTLSLSDSNNPNENGVLYDVLDNRANRQQGQSIQVLPVVVNNQKYVFAGYRVPANFAREGVEEDEHVSERLVTLTIQTDDLPVNIDISQDIRLIRPPLVLIHGLWSGPNMWDSFKAMLQEEIPQLNIVTINYETTNASYLEVNKDKLKDEIVSIRGQLQMQGIAMTRVDVLGHSMGGILGRMRAGGNQWSGAEAYYQAINFMQGDINKLITLDSPHFGSWIADSVIAFINYFDPVTQEMIVAQLKMMGFRIDGGAVEDLQTMSPPIVYLNTVQTNPASHSIVGDFLLANVDLSLLPNEMSAFFKILKRYRFNTRVDVIPGASDLVVTTQSQAGGLVEPASSIFSHRHRAATTQDVADKVIELLNAVPDSDSFEAGFPINQWP